MPFDWSTYLELARELAKGDDEASWRSAVSRAYYSAYWFAREDLNEEYAINQSRNKHDAVWSYYMNEFNLQGRSIGRAGKDLCTSRGRADYEARFTFTQKDALLKIVAAEKLIADIRTLG